MITSLCWSSFGADDDDDLKKAKDFSSLKAEGEELKWEEDEDGVEYEDNWLNYYVPILIKFP